MPRRKTFYEKDHYIADGGIVGRLHTGRHRMFDSQIFTRTQAQMDRNPWVNNAQSRGWSGADAGDKGAGFIAGLLQMFVH